LSCARRSRTPRGGVAGPVMARNVPRQSRPPYVGLMKIASTICVGRVGEPAGGCLGVPRRAIPRDGVACMAPFPIN
jgi:hypothetical protein